MDARRGMGKDPVVSITIALVRVEDGGSAKKCDSKTEASRLRESCGR